MNRSELLLLVSLGVFLAQCDRNSASKLSDDEQLPPSNCSTATLMTELDNQLYVCDDTANVSADLVKSCIQKISTIYNAFNEGCQNKFRAQVQSATTNLLLRQLAGVKVDQVQNFDATQLRSFFENLSKWYTGLGPKLFRDFYTRKGLGSRFDAELTTNESLEKLSAGLWKRINATVSIDNINEPFRTKSFQQIKRVLEAALPSDSQATKAPAEFVLKFFSDSMMPLNSRLNVLVDLHDLSCQLGACGSSDNSAVRQIVKLNASLLDHGFPQILESVNLLPTALVDVYRVLANQHSYLSSVVKADVNDNGEQRLGGLGSDFQDVLATARVDTVPEHIKDIVAFVQKFKLLEFNVQSLGLFSGRDSKTLEIGLSGDMLSAVKNRNQALISRLQNKMSAFESERTALLNAMRQKIEADLADESNSYSIRSLSLKMENLVNDLNGVRNQIAKHKESFADYVRQIEAAQDSNALAFFEQRVGADLSYTFAVSPNQAKHNSVHKETDAEVSSFRKIELKEGELLRFDVSGQWAPTCALNKSIYAQNLDLSNVLVESTGFMVASSGGTSQLRSADSVHRETYYQNQSSSFSACLGGSMGFVSASACSEITMGKNTEDSFSSTESKSHRYSADASFYSGLRLPYTPYPNAPAGALLAIVLPKGMHDPSYRQVITVIGRQSTVFAQGDSDVYLVVNDCKSSTSATTALTVDMKRSVAAHPSAKAMLSKVLESVRIIGQQAEDSIKTGSMNSRILQNIKMEIMADVSANGTLPPEFYSYPVLRDLFAYWIDKEILLVELKSEARGLEQQIAQLAVEVEKFDNAASSLKNSSNLVELQMHFASNGADLFLVTEPMTRAISYMRNRLLPMIKLHYPKILADLPPAQLQNFLPAVDAPMADLAKNVIETMDAINERLEDEYSISANQSQTLNLLFRFPKADHGTVASSIPSADAVRSQGVWDALVGASTAPSVGFDVSANDIYRPDLSYGRLSCQQVRPVITDMMLGFVLSNDLADEQVQAWNDKKISINSEFEGNLEFPQAIGPDRYRLINPDAGSKSIAVGFVRANNIGSLQQMLQNKTYAERAGLGMSPVSSLKLANIAGVRGIFNGVQGCQNCIPANAVVDIVMVYKVEVNTVAQANQIKWLDNCQP